MQTELLTDKCYSILKQEIQAGRYTKDDCIVENDVCKSMGVSKATAREVLHRLTQEGILKSYPRKGYMLNVYSREDFLKIQKLRFTIESFVVRTVIAGVESYKVQTLYEGLGQIGNHAFHLELARLLEDPFLEDTLDNLLTKADGTYASIEFRANSGRGIAQHHRELLTAIVEKDEKRALAALRADLNLEGDETTYQEEAGYQPFSIGRMEDVVYVSEPQHSPDGKEALFVRISAEKEDGAFYPRIYRCQLKTGRVELFLEENCWHPRYLAAGSIAYLSDASGAYQLYVKRQGQEAQQLTSLRHGIERFTLSRDGAVFAFEAVLYPDELLENLAFSEFTGEEKQAWLEKKEWAPLRITQINYKRDEWKGVHDGRIHCLGTVDEAGNQRLLVSERSCYQPVLSADGSRLAYYKECYTGAAALTPELFVMELSSGKSRQLTFEKNLIEEQPPGFTEDGASVVYPYYHTEGACVIAHLRRVSADGGEPVELFGVEEASSGLAFYASPRTQYGTDKPAFAVDGSYVYFLGYWNGTQRLYRISLKGGDKPEQVLDGSFSIHEFCLPDRGKVLLTRGDYYNVRDLYLHNMKNREFTRLADSNPWLSSCTLGDVRELDVPSKDGKARIHGRVVLPVNFKKGETYPAVLYIHGGPTLSFSNDFWHEFQILANAGYVVISCDPRGSAGYGLAFANEEESWGEEAYEDLMGFLDAVIEEGYVDKNRLGITGGSYGGYMTCKILMKTDRFAAAVGQRIFVNKATSYGTGDMGFYSSRVDYRKVNIKACLMARARTSLICNMDRITTPLLLLHGYNDYRCSFEQAEQLFISMKERRPEIPVRLVMFPGENHNVSRTGLLHFQKRHVQEMVDWFDRHVKGGCHE